MQVVILGRDRPGSGEQRAAARPAHLERAQALRDAGRLLLAGPIAEPGGFGSGVTGVIGSLIVAEFESLDAARDWIAADPYVLAGVFAEVEVHPFRKVLP